MEDNTLTCCVCRNNKKDPCVECEATPPFAFTECNHFYHRSCLDNWTKKEDAKCPMCRAEIPETSIHYTCVDNDTTCTICLEEIKINCHKPVHNKTCDHGKYFHRCCIDRWLSCRKICPLDNQTWIDGVCTEREKYLLENILPKIKTPIDYITQMMDSSISSEDWIFIQKAQVPKKDQQNKFTKESLQAFENMFLSKEFNKQLNLTNN